MIIRLTGARNPANSYRKAASISPDFPLAIIARVHKAPNLGLVGQRGTVRLGRSVQEIGFKT